MKSYSLFCLIILCLWMFSACQQEDLDDVTAQQVPATDSRLEQTLDSIYLYAQQIYLWNDDLPSYRDFAPRQYQREQEDLTNFGEELSAIAAYAVNPETRYSFEFRSRDNRNPKFSYIEEKDSGNEGILSALRSTEYDYGFDMSLLDDSIYVSFVVPSSPADEIGLNRGDRVLRLNGNDLYALSAAALNQVYSDALNGDRLQIEVRKADGTQIDTTFGKANYENTPVYNHRIIEEGGAKVGYLAYGRFGETDDAEAYFADIFGEFTREGIRDLVVDLRYNGGGFVSTAELLCNYILPSSQNGNVLYSEEFNTTMQQGKAEILSNQPYLDQNGEAITFEGRDATYADLDFSLDRNTTRIQKEGSLETVERVYFIISGNSASASELVISALKPYLEVKTIGRQSFGKPVGFFPVTIDRYDLYLASFRTINADGESDYYQGLLPDLAAYDDVSHDFGDIEEYALNLALQELQVNVRRAPAPTKTKESRRLGGDRGFKGMIETRLKVKP